MTVLTVVRDVAAVVGVNIPTTVFTNITANRTMSEMLSLANEMAQRISYDLREWTKLTKSQVYTGDGIKTNWPLPADYKRMLLTSNVYGSVQPRQPLRFIPDPDEWMIRRAGFEVDSRGEWTMLGGEMQIYPALAVGVTARYAYLERNCVKLAAGGSGEAFTADGDSFVLDERLLKLGMIWQWKANKGGAYAEDLGTYADALAIAMGADRPAPIIAGSMPITTNAKVAYPFEVPTP